MAGVNHPVQIQRTYRPPVVHRKWNPGQHILLSCPGIAQKACAVPEAVDASAQKQEVVQIPLWETEQHPSDPIALSIPSVCLEMQGIHVEIHEQAGADVIRNTLLALRQLC